MMKLLIVCPSFKILGGVSNHYQGLDEHWTCQKKYCFQGKRVGIPAALTFIPDILNFIYQLIIYRPDIVIINPSFRTYQLKRDSIYARISKIFKRKLVTFIHGWDWDLANKLDDVNQYYWISFLKKSDIIFVLFSGFKEKLQLLGLKNNIVLTTTKVASELIEATDNIDKSGNVKTLLFLARLEENKGIFIVVETFKILKEKYPYLKLIICGSGSAEELLMEEIKDEENIEYRGRVSDNELIRAYQESDIYFLPTYGEGMATSILEAMTFGLTILSRPEGGIIDFFEEEKMGKLVASLDPKEYAEIIDHWIQSPEKVQEISKYNWEYARSHFDARKVVDQLESNFM